MRRTAQAPTLFTKARPGDPDWPGFCDWARGLLWYDHATALIRYRPRDATAFTWADSPAKAARIARGYNEANANRAMPVKRARHYGAHIRLDGLVVAWQSIRQALGVAHLPDGNVELPQYSECSDAMMVRHYGLDFTLQRMAMLADARDARRVIRDEAIDRLAATMGRRLTAVERAIVAKPRTQITATELHELAQERGQRLTVEQVRETLAKLRAR